MTVKPPMTANSPTGNARRDDPFRYGPYEFDPATGRLVCHYGLGDLEFSEEVTVLGAPAGTGAAAPGADVEAVPEPASGAALQAAARLVHLLAGISYYKAGAPEVVDLSAVPTTPDERAFLRTFYLEGLGEFAYRNGLDLSGLRFEGPDAAPAAPIPWAPDTERPLVPFGGGIDSVVTVESIREQHPGLSLFVANRPGDRFAAIERAVVATGLPVVRAERRIDRQLLRSAELGFLNGHVPITGILSAVAVLAAAVTGHGSVVMSNERSASQGNVEVDGRSINHQWSKGAAFEEAWRHLLGQTFSPGPEYFSYLRGRSELWVAEHFAVLGHYHRVFRSCNKAFAQDPGRRLDRWCGRCDKCCFVDLVLAPYLPPDELGVVFGGHEPLTDSALADRFRLLLGTGSGSKPFDCVGDVDECRAALAATAARPDRSNAPMVQALARQLPDRAGALAAAAVLADELGPDFVPAAYRDPVGTR